MSWPSARISNHASASPKKGGMIQLMKTQRGKTVDFQFLSLKVSVVLWYGYCLLVLRSFVLILNFVITIFSTLP